MPNRIIREGILDSREVNNLPEAAEILYRRLMSIVDDYGRFEADSELIRARCFARQLERWPISRVEQSLCDISKTKLIKIYECDGKKYLEFNKFGQRMRTPSKFPPSFDGHLTVTCPSVAGVNVSNTNLPTTTTHTNNDSDGGVQIYPARRVVEALRAVESPKAAMLQLREMWMEKGKPTDWDDWSQAAKDSLSAGVSEEDLLNIVIPWARSYLAETSVTYIHSPRKLFRLSPPPWKAKPASTSGTEYKYV